MNLQNGKDIFHVPIYVSWLIYCGVMQRDPPPALLGLGKRYDLNLRTKFDSNSKP